MVDETKIYLHKNLISDITITDHLKSLSLCFLTLSEFYFCWLLHEKYSEQFVFRDCWKFLLPDALCERKFFLLHYIIGDIYQAVNTFFLKEK